MILLNVENPWDAVLGITSIVAIVAAIASFFYTSLISRRAEKPFISSWYSKDTGKYIELSIKNYGKGPANILGVIFIKDSQVTKVTSIAPLLQDNANFYMEDNLHFKIGNTHYLAPGERTFLFKSTFSYFNEKLKYLDSQGRHHTESSYEKFYSTIREEMSKIQFVILYKDTFGRLQKPYYRCYDERPESNENRFRRFTKWDWYRRLKSIQKIQSGKESSLFQSGVVQ